MASRLGVTDASVADAEALTKLVYSAAPKLLSDIFGGGNSEQTQQFLATCFAQPHGQFGFDNHRVVRDAEQVVGSVCGWHDQLPSNFDGATVTQLHQFFGFAKSVEILERNRVISRWIKPPEKQEYAIGHLSVAPTHRRRGIAQLLLTNCLEAAQRMNKHQVLLDVETTNHAAIQCYLKFGFSASPQTSESPYVRLTMAVDKP